MWVAGRSTCQGDDAAVRRQADELAPLLAHHGAILGPPDQPTYNRDDERFRETANRLSQQGENAERSFRWKTTTTRQEHNWTITEESVKDHTLEAAVFYGSLGMLMNREAQRSHQTAVFRLRQEAAKDLMRIGDDVEQLRLSSQERLRDQCYMPFTGPARSEPRLEFSLDRVDPQGSPIEEEWRQRDLGQPQQVHPMLRIRNPGRMLHRVMLTLDYFHYRLPDSPVMRQVFWIPEWKTDGVFAVAEAFRLNQGNRTIAGLADSINELRGSCGQPTFPGFLGVLRVRYSLASDECRQESVEVNFGANRLLIRDSMLKSAEDLAIRLMALGSNSDEWQGLNAVERASREKIMTGASRECAKAAIDLAPSDWPEKEHAEALRKDFRVVGRKLESLRESALKSCADGHVYVGTRMGPWAQHSHMTGRYAIEFQSQKPTAQHIDVVITRAGDGVNQADSKGFLGQLVANPEDRTEVILSLKPAAKAPLGGKKPATTSTSPRFAKQAPRPSNRTKPNPVDIRTSKTPGLAWFEREWQLKWKADRWACVFDQTVFEFAETKTTPPPVAGAGRGFEDRPKPVPSRANVALRQGPAGFTEESVWAGSRQVTGANGVIIRKEDVQLTVLHRVSETPSTGGGDFEAELVVEGQPKVVIHMKVGGLRADAISWMTKPIQRAGERFPRGTAPYAGTLRDGVIEVISQPTTDNSNADNAMIQLRRTK